MNKYQPIKYQNVNIRDGFWKKRQDINARFAPLSADMETAAVAHVCHVNKVPFVSVRTLTDTATHSGAAAFEANCAKAAALSADFVRRMLRAMA